MVNTPEILEKNKILSFTEEKFFNEGFYKTTMDEIARELNVSKNTIYKHFPTKEQLIFEIINNFVKDTKCKIETELNTDENAVYKFVSMLNVLSQNVARFSDKWLHDMRVHTPQIWAKIDEMRRQLMMKNLSRLIEQGKKEELFENYSTDIVLIIFISSIRAVVNPDFLLHSKHTKKEVISIVFKLLLNGILTKKGLQIFKKLNLPQ